MKQVTPMEWSAALRSGDYKQARGILCRADGSAHCCLGVLSDLADITHPCDLGPRGLGYPSSLHLSWFRDLRLDEVKVHHPTVSRATFEALNDRLELSFDQIADLIDAYLVPEYEAAMS